MKTIYDIFILIFSNPVYTSILFMSIVTALLWLYAFSVTGHKTHRSHQKGKKLS